MIDECFNIVWRTCLVQEDLSEPLNDGKNSELHFPPWQLKQHTDFNNNKDCEYMFCSLPSITPSFPVE